LHQSRISDVLQKHGGNFLRSDLGDDVGKIAG